MFVYSRLSVLLAGLCMAAALPAGAQEPCGICARAVVINSSLATCFLDRYPQLSSRSGSAVVIDLADCETDRSVVAPLRGPALAGEEPSTRFMLSLPQLACLKAKLEEPGLALDPAARIDLDSCE